MLQSIIIDIVFFIVYNKHHIRAKIKYKYGVWVAISATFFFALFSFKIRSE